MTVYRSCLNFYTQDNPESGWIWFSLAMKYSAKSYRSRDASPSTGSSHSLFTCWDRCSWTFPKQLVFVQRVCISLAGWKKKEMMMMTVHAWSHTTASIQLFPLPLHPLPLPPPWLLFATLFPCAAIDALETVRWIHASLMTAFWFHNGKLQFFVSFLILC